MKDRLLKLLLQALPGVKKNILLKKHTTFKIGGPAKYFLVAKGKNSLLTAVKVAKKIKLPVFVLGGGSNLLVSDKGFNGLVIKIQSKEPIILKKNNIIKASTGIKLGKMVRFSINKSLQGLEWAGGLPGTFGGAIRGNAGAFGGEMKDSVISVQALDRQYILRNFTNRQAKFSYRNSIFKQKGFTIISAVVAFKKGNKKELRVIADSHIAYRKEKHPLEYPSAGSVFKNVAVEKLSPKLQQEFADKVKQDPFPIVPAAWFIIGAGLTGKKVGKAQISKKHSNYMVNLGGAKAQDVLTLIQIAKKEVKEKYHIDLEVEIQYVE